MSQHVRPETLHALYRGSFTAAGLSRGQADVSADGLLYADLRGIDSHGAVNLNRIYLPKLRAGEIDPSAAPRPSHRDGRVTVFDGHRAIGFACGSAAMDAAVADAEAVGCGVACVRNATHAGAMGYYLERALARGCIAIAATNLGGQALVAPPGAARPLVGTNVLAIGFPARDEPPFVLDMSTAAVSTGKVRTNARRGGTIPAGWLFARDGGDVTDPAALDRGDAFLAPLGGRASWYKGYGLALACELLCSTLAAAASAPEAANLGNEGADADIGLFFTAIRPPALGGAGDLFDRVDAVLGAVRQVAGADGAPLSYPGAVEARVRAHRARVGIPLDAEVARALETTAASLGLPFAPNGGTG
jgi:LDH2 family malate/lactate/ureidoglycolate dehydrogenase